MAMNSKHIFVTLFLGLVVSGGAFVLKEHTEEKTRLDAVMAENPAYHPRLVKVDLEPTATSSYTNRKTIFVTYSEVTIGHWQACYDDGGCSYQPKMRDNETLQHPVTKVSYFDTEEFVRWISLKTGQIFRLPLESEWNYFSRDVISPPEKLFDDPRLAWAADYVTFSNRPKSSKTKIVGGYGANQYGLVDLQGNVWEWTQTCWSTNYSDLTTSKERSEACGGVRIMQGEHRSYQSELIRDPKIGGCSVGSPPNNVGFRLVMEEKA